MNFVAKNPTWRKLILDDFLAALSARPAAALLVTPQVKLLKASIVLTPTTPLATLTAQEADFTGYAAIALPTLVGPINPTVLTTGLTADVNFVVGSSPTVTNNIYGYYVDHNTAADWVLAELFDNPVPMALAGDFLGLAIMAALAYNNITS